MGKSRFNAKKFLKTVKSGIKKPDENYSEDNLAVHKQVLLDTDSMCGAI